jgi:protein-S-isoprenylcysteine O-methyltransferase Ste14
MSLVLIIIFLVFAVGMRVLVQRIKTGDFGVRVASPDAPLIEILPGGIFVLTFCIALVLVILGHLGSLSADFEFSLWARWTAFALGLSGILITVVSQNQMGDAWRIGVDQQEVTALKMEGIYAKTRNPIYFGILLFWIGLCLTFANLWLWLCAAICWVCIELIVREIEEPYLEKIHGEGFREYVRKTNRYLPL